MNKYINCASMNLQDLTEEDFTMMIAGLEILPEKENPGVLVASFLDIIAPKSGADRKQLTPEQITKEFQRRKKDLDQKRAVLKEEVQILIGKLLMLKRQIMQENAMKSANEIINPDK